MGRPEKPPATPAEAVATGAMAAGTGWFIAAGVLGLTHAGIKRLLDRCRSRAWEREWARVGPGWRTGSH